MQTEQVQPYGPSPAAPHSLMHTHSTYIHTHNIHPHTQSHCKPCATLESIARVCTATLPKGKCDLLLPNALLRGPWVLGGPKTLGARTEDPGCREDRGPQVLGGLGTPSAGRTEDPGAGWTKDPECWED